MPELSAISIAPAPPAPGPAQPGAARRGLFDALLRGLTAAGGRRTADKRDQGDGAAAIGVALPGVAPQATLSPVAGPTAQDDADSAAISFSAATDPSASNPPLALDGLQPAPDGAEGGDAAPPDATDAATPTDAEQAATRTSTPNATVAVARGEIALLAALAAGQRGQAPEPPAADAISTATTTADSYPPSSTYDAGKGQLDQQEPGQIDDVPPTSAHPTDTLGNAAPAGETTPATALFAQQAVASAATAPGPADTAQPGALPTSIAGSSNAMLSSSDPATSGARSGDTTVTLSTDVPPLLTVRTVYVRGDDGRLTLTLGLAGALPLSARDTGDTTPAVLSSTPQRPGKGDQALPVQETFAPAGGTAGTTAVSFAGLSQRQDATPDGSTGGDRGATAAPAAATGAATLGQSAPTSLDLGNLVSSLALTIRAGLAEARLHLRPAGLGQVTVQISAGREGISLRLAADTAAATGLLLAHAGDLRAALAARGIAVADLHVAPGPAGAWSVNEAHWQREGRQHPGSGAANSPGEEAPLQDDGESDA
jgi:flagellar hook-length control protein FliK